MKMNKRKNEITRTLVKMRSILSKKWEIPTKRALKEVILKARFVGITL